MFSDNKQCVLKTILLIIPLLYFWKKIQHNLCYFELQLLCSDMNMNIDCTTVLQDLSFTLQDIGRVLYLDLALFASLSNLLDSIHFPRYLNFSVLLGNSPHMRIVPYFTCMCLSPWCLYLLCLLIGDFQTRFISNFVQNIQHILDIWIMG